MASRCDRLARTAMQEHRTLQVACIDVDQPQVLAQALADRIDPLPVAWRNQQRLGAAAGVDVPA